MSTIDANTPAFPSHGSMGEVAHQGMTLRDYFATAVMPTVIQSAIGAYDGVDGGVDDVMGQSKWLDEARAAYAIADAMMEARAGK